MIKYNVIYASDQGNGFGFKNSLPWHYPKDLKHFKKKTSGNTIICGRITYENLPKPVFKNRNVICVSSALSPEQALEQASKHETKIFIIGGVKLIQQALANEFKNGILNKVYHTHIPGYHECDVYMTAPKLNLIKNKLIYNIYIHGEMQYIKLVKHVLNSNLISIQKSEKRRNTLSVFGTQMRFDLRENFPLLTTKKMFWKGIVEELLWMIRGETNAKSLSKLGVHIWDHNASKEFLKSRNLNYPEGELGPVYGFQWRKYGSDFDPETGEFITESESKSKSIDQLKQCIHMIKTDPDSRRIIMTAWNPLDIDKMALPPCHVLTQFYVSGNNLSLQLYQRSADIGLGMPFNIASYSLLLLIVAKICNLNAAEFVYTVGDAHIYDTHITGLSEQIKRKPLKFPSVICTVSEIDNIKSKDIELFNYKSHEKINLPFTL